MNKTISTILLSTATLSILGKSKYMPGTIGSFAAIPIFYCFSNKILLFKLLFFIFIFIIAIISSDYYEKFYNIKDPKSIIIDETCGYMLVLLFIPFTYSYLISSFILFRVFDIIKLYPIKKIESIKGGFGIVLDDIAAGCYTLAVLWLWIVLI
ncbi:MAG: phosphatidylglycerophosphatase A [Deferribacterota bacterium]|nr:phosphatidylglycerophosphatase A [Deferribacterota bacterium]